MNKDFLEEINAYKESINYEDGVFNEGIEVALKQQEFITGKKDYSDNPDNSDHEL